MKLTEYPTNTEAFNAHGCNFETMTPSQRCAMAEDGVMVLTVWEHSVTKHQFEAHLTLRHGDEVKVGDKVRVVFIKGHETAPGGPMTINKRYAMAGEFEVLARYNVGNVRNPRGMEVAMLLR